MEFRFVRQPLWGYSQVTDEYLDQLEQKEHFSFPPVLREYYLRYNGCEIKDCVGNHGEDLFVATRIIPIGTGTDDFEERRSDDRIDGMIQPHLIPFAENPYDGIYYWDGHTQNIYLTFLSDQDTFIYICTGIDTFFNILNHTCDVQDEKDYIDINEIK